MGGMGVVYKAVYAVESSCTEMRRASLSVIMTAKQLSYVVKGCQNYNQHGTKNSYNEHPFKHANRKNYHDRTRTCVHVSQVHHRVRKEYIKVLK